MSHPLVLKRRTWFLAPPQAGHARVAAPGVSAPGNPVSSDGVCKEFAFTSNTGPVVPWFVRVTTATHRIAGHDAGAPMYVA